MGLQGVPFPPEICSYGPGLPSCLLVPQITEAFCLPRYSWHLTMFTCLASPSNLPPGTPHTVARSGVRWAEVLWCSCEKALPVNILKHSCSGRRRKCPCLSHRAGVDIKIASIVFLYTIFTLFSPCCTIYGMPSGTHWYGGSAIWITAKRWQHKHFKDHLKTIKT